MQKKPIITDTYSLDLLIERGGLYVDKTRYFHQLVTGAGRCYFCSRPRRFGKSLAISTFENIFLGRRELFQGLYIAETDYDWETFPVIHIDMSRMGASSAEKLSQGLLAYMEEHAKKYGVSIPLNWPGQAFDSLITALREKTGKKVVILIDEYDHPLTENIDNPDGIDAIRLELGEFYKIIKGQEPSERFVFMTGITRFNKVSIFSKLNNLTDITMVREYACMFGYTQGELEANFAAYMDGYVGETGADRAELVAKVRKWYNGFRFDYEAETVYNPVSVGQFFNNGCRFQNYWFATATPTFITRLAKKHRLTQEDIETAKISDASLNTFDIGSFAKGGVSKASLIQLLFQTGYLTINERVDTITDLFLSVRFPNYEVAVSFQRILFEAYTGMESNDALSYVANIIEAANAGKTERMVELFRSFLSEIPYTIQIPAEKYYQTVIFSILKMCGMDVEAESATNKGRIDSVLDTQGILYVIEFKMDRSAETAARQIREKEYFQRFTEYARAKGKEIRYVGMSFSAAERNITDWTEESRIS